MSRRFPGTSARRAAFTLIELTISAALMALILTSAYLCLSSSVSSRKLIEARAEAAQSARVALALIGADLRAACPLTKEIPFLGMQRMLGTVQADNLDFATHNYTPRRPQEGDFCEVSYFLQSDPATGGFSLWRRRLPTIAVKPLSGGKREEIARGLQGLKFEYYDGFDWYDNWGDPDGKAQTSQRPQPNLVGLPEAVRVTLWFETTAKSSRKPGAEDANEESENTLAFQTVCRLNLADAALRNTASSSSNNDRNSNTQPAQNGTEGAPQ
jgi:hypothetical protein